MSAVPTVHGAGSGGPRRRIRRAGLVVAAAVAVFVAGYAPKYFARRRLVAQSRSAAAALPRVRVIDAVAGDSGRSLTLPGDLVAYQRTLVYARATGFVRRFNVDIGSHVALGDVLAELDTPELSDQAANARAALAQKEAALAQSVASSDFADVVAVRQAALVAQKLVAQQDYDQAHAQALVAEATVKAAASDVAAARATVMQLEQLVAFGKVRAPFAGTVTQRLVEVGSLVSTGPTAAALFELEATDPIRVFVKVPQAFASSVHVDQSASMTVRQYPGRTFTGRVTRTAGALDPTSRTLNTQIDVPNPSGELLAGMYGDATLDVALAHRIVRVPSSAVITDARGVHVAIVDDAGIVHLRAVRSGPDDGKVVDLVDGLNGGEHVVVNPGGDVTEGMHVVTVASPPTP